MSCEPKVHNRCIYKLTTQYTTQYFYHNNQKIYKLLYQYLMNIDFFLKIYLLLNMYMTIYQYPISMIFLTHTMIFWNPIFCAKK